MFRNGAQFAGLTTRPIKSKIILDLYLGELFQISFFPSEMGNVRFFQQARFEVIVRYTNCNLLEHG